MPFEIWITFVGAAILILVIPGPTMLLVISYSLAQGSGKSRVLIAAVVTGHLACLLLSLFGLSALKVMSPQLMIILTWFCGLYVICLGVRRVCRGVATARAEANVSNSTSLRLFSNTFLVTALNPKTLLFFVAMLPLFVSGRDASVMQFCILGATFLILSTTVSTTYSIFASRAGRLLSSQTAKTRLNIVSGAMMTVVGLIVLLQAQ